MIVGPVSYAEASGWCAPSETAYLDELPPVTWLVTPAELVALTDADRAWLDSHWALAVDGGRP